jgi:hypothetical protein
MKPRRFRRPERASVSELACLVDDVLDHDAQHRDAGPDDQRGAERLRNQGEGALKIVRSRGARPRGDGRIDLDEEMERIHREEAN